MKYFIRLAVHENIVKLKQKRGLVLISLSTFLNKMFIMLGFARVFVITIPQSGCA